MIPACDSTASLAWKLYADFTETRVFRTSIALGGSYLCGGVTGVFLSFCKGYRGSKNSFL